MYLEHWGLKRHPFRNTPEARLFFHSATHDAALAELLYAVDESLGLALLTGPFGTGKSLLLHTLLTGLKSSAEHRMGLLPNSLLSPAELVLAAARALGADELPERAADVSESYAQDRLEKRLLALAGSGRHAVLAIDDAHAIEPRPVWEALRQTLSIQSEGQPLLTLILCGAESLRERIDASPGLGERVAVHTSLLPLTPEETLDYIIHRLARSGASSGIFTRGAAESIARLAGGIPARVNRLADLSLAAAFGLGHKVVGPEVIKMASASLDRGDAPAGG
jgi:type II secretory pathway predicted ATPase ExeA